MSSINPKRIYFLYGFLDTCIFIQSAFWYHSISSKSRFFYIFLHFSVLLTRFRTGSAVPHLAAFWVPRTAPPFFIAASIKNARLTQFDARRSKPTKTAKSSRFRLLYAPMWHRTRAWLFLYIYFIFISLSSDNTTVFPFYPALSRSFPYTPLLWHGMCSSTFPAWIPHSGRQKKS